MKSWLKDPSDENVVLQNGKSNLKESQERSAKLLINWKCSENQ